MKILDRVTFTGPDNSIKPEDLLALSREFPFVEWGILASAGQTGKCPRFPDTSWIEALQKLHGQNDMNLSLHLCGRWVRELLKGRVIFSRDLLHSFQRVQLNFHAEKSLCDPEQFVSALIWIGDPRQFIFQIDGGIGNEHLEAVFAYAGEVVDAVALFDISGGAGILPERWPKPLYFASANEYRYHGYAGGLGPNNLEEQLPLILEAADGGRIWIDMETRVRSGDDKIFDLDKVRRCLEIAAPYVRTPWK